MVSFSISAGIRGLMLNGTNVLASRTVHAKMTFNLLHCEVGNFLERVPMGRIINRFSEDIENLDSKIGNGFSGVYLFMAFNITNIISLAFGAGNMLICIPAVFFIILSLVYRNWYMEAKREVVRLQRTTKSPITGCIGEAINGMVELRAMKKQEFTSDFINDLINENSKNTIMIYALNGWFKSRVLFATLFIMILPSYSYVLFTLYYFPETVITKDLIYFVLISGWMASSMIILLNMVCDLEVNLISLERCINFTEIPNEENYLNFDIHKKNFLYPSKKHIKHIVENNRDDVLFP